MGPRTRQAAVAWCKQLRILQLQQISLLQKSLQEIGKHGA